MFKFLKDKLRNAVSKFSKSVEEEVVEKEVGEAEEKLEEIPDSELKKIKKQEKVSKREKREIEKELEEAEKVEKEIERKEKQRVKKEKEEEKEIKKEIREAKELIKERKEEVTELEKEKEIEKAVGEAEELERELEEKEAKVDVEGKELKEEKPKKSLFGRLKEVVSKTKLSEEKFEDLFLDLELALLESSVAVEVIDLIKADLKKELTEGRVSRVGIEKTIKKSLTKTIKNLFDVNGIDLIEEIKKKKEKPFVIAFVGINGSGKTTTLAKIGKLMQDNNLSVVIAAGDTFRVAAIEQLEEHANNLSIKIVKQDYGADAAAVCFDAIAHARAKNLDVVLIDTAGRSNANVNLMDELRKVIKVAKPDLTIFVGDSLTGNDAVEQAKEFNSTVGIDGIILAKSDVDEKGGCAISISYVTKKPILYLGCGQNYSDLKEFSPKLILENLG